MTWRGLYISSRHNWFNSETGRKEGKATGEYTLRKLISKQLGKDLALTRLWQELSVTEG